MSLTDPPSFVPSKFIVARMDNSSEEEEKMALDRKKGLKKLLVDRAKGPVQKDTSRSQSLPTLLPPPPPPPPPPAINLLAMPNLKKKRKEKEVAEEGEVVRQKEPKQ